MLDLHYVACTHLSLLLHCFNAVACQHAGVGCAAEITKKDMASHLSVCPYEAVKGLCSLATRIDR
jgi:hypothetical protein